MNCKLIILFLSICFFTSIAFAINSSMCYESENVTLSGIIKVKKFPAPTKNEYIGDKEEIYRYLVLDHPIEFAPHKTYSGEKIEMLKNISEVQIVNIEDYLADSAEWPCNYCSEHHKFFKDAKCNKCEHANWSDKLIGKHVSATGSLYGRIVRVVVLAKHFSIVNTKKVNRKNVQKDIENHYKSSIAY